MLGLISCLQPSQVVSPQLFLATQKIALYETTSQAVV